MEEKLYDKHEHFMEKVSEQLQNAQNSFFERLALLLVGATGLIAALAWDEFLHGLFEHLFEQETLFTKFAYALIVTAGAVGASLWLRQIILAPVRRIENIFKKENK